MSKKQRYLSASPPAGNMRPNVAEAEREWQHAKLRLTALRLVMEMRTSASDLGNLMAQAETVYGFAIGLLPDESPSDYLKRLSSHL